MQIKCLFIAVVLFSLCLSDAFGWDSEYKQGFALSSCVELSELIVVGRVTQKDFVKRILSQDIGEQITTDITVTVTQAIKGTPNAGNKQVKFMYEGGQYTDPITGDPMEVIVTSESEFAVGEEILLFLFKGDGVYYEYYPHDKLQVLRGDYGKRLIKSDKIITLYAMEDDSLKPVGMPLDLALKIAKAAIKDKDAVVELEKDIKDAIAQRTGSDINLPQTLIDRLMEEAEGICNYPQKLDS